MYLFHRSQNWLIAVLSFCADPAEDVLTVDNLIEELQSLPLEGLPALQLLRRQLEKVAGETLPAALEPSMRESPSPST